MNVRFLLDQTHVNTCSRCQKFLSLRYKNFYHEDTKILYTNVIALLVPVMVFCSLV